MTLDLPSQTFVARLTAGGRKPSWTLPPDEVRANGHALATMIGPGPAMKRVVDETTDTGTTSSVAVRFLMPVDRPAAMIVYLHGGCWVFGDINDNDAFARRLAVESGCAVALVDYHKAPEHPAPAAVEDAWAALLHVAARTPAVTGRDLPLLVMGDSAGGNLAAVLALRARDRGGPELALQVLVYPITDCDLDTASYIDSENQLLLQRRTMQWAWDLYAPDVASRVDPELSPLRAADLAGVAPAVIVTAEHDVLRDEGEAYAARLDEVGLLRDLTRFPGQMHGFVGMIDLLPGSADGLRHIAGKIRATVAEPAEG